jgi:hypothetical protein
MSTTAFWKGGETYHIIQAMKATGNRPGVIAQWKESVAAWAQMNHTDPDAAAVNAWLPLWKVQPFYSAIELAPLWPALGIATGFTDKWPSVLKSAKRLEHELDFHGLPRLRGYEKEWRDYFIVERIHYWRSASREEILREIENAQR